MGTRDPWTALHECLRTAMVDGFAEVMQPDLGEGLRRDLDACLEAAGGAPPELLRFRKRLAEFEGLGRQDRSVLVARGMRLCATWRPRGAASAKPRRSTKRAPAGEVIPRLADVELPPPAPASTLPGVGPSTAKKLEARGLADVVELAYLLPAGYEDRRHRKPLADLEEGEVAVIEGRGRSLRQGFARGRFMATLEIEVEEPSGDKTVVVARWFHRMGGLEKWAKGGSVLAIGPVRSYKDRLTMAHPELRDPGDPGPSIAVRYPVVEGIPPRTLAKIIRAAADRVRDETSGFVDALPESVAGEHGFIGQAEALTRLHQPDEHMDDGRLQSLLEGSSEAHRRLAFDEFFFFQLAVLLERGQLQAQPAPLLLPEDAFDPERLRASLPFEPTAAQWRVLRELERDMSEGPPMLRLLQGDVGSGKTAVAFGAAAAIVRAGGQVAFMAPTEILAEQHARTLAPWCERVGLKMELLTGATPKAVRRSRLALLADHKIDLLVGTHALLTGDVAFAELGLVVVDEQHRFGVEQRAVLRRKGTMPHLLVMTATPIPRTMALCAYGELEVSVIDEMPPGREPPQTHLLTGKRGLDKVRRGVAKRVAAGDQAFVVCPLVEASDVLDVTDVEATAEALRRVMPKQVVEVVHGRMSSKDKDAVMRRFRSKEVDVLVATTVIEVGVDVPDARVMVVEHAERFGLAQLHQLRGRVGRGGGASYCLLHTASGPGSDVAARLSVMTETTDGFVVAERDLALRGPGEIFGMRQAGAPRLRFGRFGGEGTKLLVAAREAARGLLQRDPNLDQHPRVRAELKRRRAGQAAISADAG